MARHTWPLLLLLGLPTACAQVPEYTLAERLSMLGLPEREATCLAAGLEARLTDSELAQFTRFTEGLSRTDRPSDLLFALRHVNDFRIAGIAASTGAECLYSAYG